ncbi:gustatory receptor 5a for trehalose-like isoform X2 [Periplaneta americana]|uniref:gustatory receptor 5a for trehalose-like isoform X2 n=1 Tax=Periplaneta americana TaxID=6978 RepID=UPI0037E7D887
MEEMRRRHRSGTTLPSTSTVSEKIEMEVDVELRSTNCIMRDLFVSQKNMSRHIYRNSNRSEETDINVIEESTLNIEPRVSLHATERQESFHSAIGWILTMAQIFGLMPVRGVLAPTPDKLQFHCLSIRVVYASLLLVCLVIIEVFSIKDTVQSIKEEGVRVLSNVRDVTVGAVFYGNASVATLLFLKLARRWPHIVTEWSHVEKLPLSYHSPRPSIKLKFSLITALVMITALCEHILSVISNIPEYINPEEAVNSPCPTDKNFAPNTSLFNMEEILKVYSCRSHQFIFRTINYNIYFGSLLLIGSRLATFTWNYTDLFVILISLGLREEFIHFNKRIKEAKNKILTQLEWQELRESYNFLSALVKTVDSAICGIMLLSFTNNLIFICLQITQTLDTRNTFDKVYFFGSFIFLVGRTILVMKFAAQVNDESRACLSDIFNCSSRNCCIEMERLQIQITTDEIALTGMRIFSIKRQLMLVVAGCLCTYELILVQFYVEMKGNLKND